MGSGTSASKDGPLIRLGSMPMPVRHNENNPLQRAYQQSGSVNHKEQIESPSSAEDRAQSSDYFCRNRQALPVNTQRIEERRINRAAGGKSCKRGEQNYRSCIHASIGDGVPMMHTEENEGYTQTDRGDQSIKSWWIKSR